MTGLARSAEVTVAVFVSAVDTFAGAGEAQVVGYRTDERLSETIGHEGCRSRSWSVVLAWSTTRVTLVNLSKRHTMAAFIGPRHSGQVRIRFAYHLHGRNQGVAKPAESESARIFRLVPVVVTSFMGLNGGRWVAGFLPTVPRIRHALGGYSLRERILLSTSTPRGHRRVRRWRWFAARVSFWHRLARALLSSTRQWNHVPSKAPSQVKCHHMPSTVIRVVRGAHRNRCTVESVVNRLD